MTSCWGAAHRSAATGRSSRRPRLGAELGTGVDPAGAASALSRSSGGSPWRHDGVQQRSGGHGVQRSAPGGGQGAGAGTARAPPLEMASTPNASRNSARVSPRTNMAGLVLGPGGAGEGQRAGCRGGRRARSHRVAVARTAVAVAGVARTARERRRPGGTGETGKSSEGAMDDAAPTQPRAGERCSDRRSVQASCQGLPGAGRRRHRGMPSRPR